MNAFPHAFQDALILHSNQQGYIKAMISNLYLELVQEVLLAMNNSHTDVVRRQLQQMNCLRLSSMSDLNIFDLTSDQYDAFNIITSAISGGLRYHGVRFFVTGPGGTGKSYLLQALEYWFKSRAMAYLKMAPTGIAAINISGQTIHSALLISPRPINSNYQSLIFNFENRLLELRKLNVLIIDEISMVDGELFDFISQLFRRIRQRPEPFGNLHLICFGDLMQLPPVSGIKVFKSLSWQTLFPLFLTTCRR
jgi:DNA replication protein DnaC